MGAYRGGLGIAANPNEIKTFAVIAEKDPGLLGSRRAVGRNLLDEVADLDKIGRCLTGCHAAESTKIRGVTDQGNIEDERGSLVCSQYAQQAQGGTDDRGDYLPPGAYASGADCTIDGRTFPCHAPKYSVAPKLCPMDCS